MCSEGRIDDLLVLLDEKTTRDTLPLILRRLVVLQKMQGNILLLVSGLLLAVTAMICFLQRFVHRRVTQGRHAIGFIHPYSGGGGGGEWVCHHAILTLRLPTALPLVPTETTRRHELMNAVALGSKVCHTTADSRRPMRSCFCEENEMI